jgi:hypothetical protein
MAFVAVMQDDWCVDVRRKYMGHHCLNREFERGSYAGRTANVRRFERILPPI